MMNFKKKCLLFCLMILHFILLCSASTGDLQELYLNTEYTEIIKKLESKDFKHMAVEEQLLYTECKARTGGGYLVLRDLNTLIAKKKPDDNILAVAGILYHAMGHMETARKHLNSALAINPHNSKALLAKALLMLYFRDFDKAEQYFSRAGAENPALSRSRLYQNFGLEIYHASRNIDKILEHYQLLIASAKERAKPDTARKFQLDARMMEQVKGQRLYQVSTRSQRVELPIVNHSKNDFYKCLQLKIGGESYNVLLDTGNAPGWVIHNGKLLEELTNLTGNEGQVSTGSVEKKLSSRSILTREITFEGLNLKNLKGIFFNKPRPGYFDANLNPLYIRDRVVTMDYANNKFILRSKKQFDNDLAKETRDSWSKLPLYGYEWPFIPAEINGYARGLAMIETGAEDVSIKLEFAQHIHLPLTPKTKTWRGKEYNYHETSIDVLVGIHLFHRPKTGVWPKRFYDTITGLYDNIMIGPWALEGKYILSFDPFDRVVILQSR